MASSNPAARGNGGLGRSPLGSPWEYAGGNLRASPRLSPKLSPGFSPASGLGGHDGAPALDGFALDGDGEQTGLENVLSSFRKDSNLNLFLSDDFDVYKLVGMAVRDGNVMKSLNETEAAANLISAHVREEVTRRQDALLGEVEAVGALEQQIEQLSKGLEDLGHTTDGLVDALNKPFERLHKAVVKMVNVSAGSDIVHKVSRFQGCFARLHGFLRSDASADGESLAAIADATRELEDLLLVPELERVDVVSKDLPASRKAITEFKTRVVDILRNDLMHNDQVGVGAALQSFATIGILRERIMAELDRLVSAAQASISAGFDAKQTLPSSGPTDSSMRPASAQITDLWTRIDNSVDGLHDVAVQSIKLQIVLQRKQDPETYEPLSKNLDVNVSRSFLHLASKLLADQFQALARAKKRTPGAVLFDALCDEYPRLLAKFTSLSERMYNAASLSTLDGLSSEAVIERDAVEGGLVGALQPVERRYLTVSLSRVTDPIMSLFSGGSIPGEVAAAGVAKLFAAELGSARGEKRLFRHSAKNVAAALYMYNAKAQDLCPIVNRRQAIDLYNGLFSLSSSAQLMFGLQIAAEPDITEAAGVMNAMAHTALEKPFAEMQAMVKGILEHMHDEYLKPERSEIAGTKTSAGASPARKFSRDLACECMEEFVRRASLLWSMNKDLRERIAKDMSDIETAAISLTSHRDLGTAYSGFRALRRLVLMDIEELFEPDEDVQELMAELRPSIVCLHILGRAEAPLLQPHRRMQWPHSKMVAWLRENSEEEAWKMVLGSLDAYQMVRESAELEDENRSMRPEYQVLRTIGPRLLDRYVKSGRSQ